MSIEVQDIAIPIDELSLEGSLAIPRRAAGLVMFARGSGSSRHGPCNGHVAALLDERGLATLLFALLTADEERLDAIDATLRFDAGRAPVPIGYSGGSTGAAAALIGDADTWALQANRDAATRMTAPHEVAAVRGATHLFEKPGALDEVARLAGSWFIDHCAPARVKEAS